MKPDKGRLGLMVAIQMIVGVFVLCISAPPAAGQAADSLVPANRWPAKPAQPIAFSHKTHVSKNVQCQVCHTNPAPGNQMTLASTAACMKCHATAAKNSAEVKKLAGFDAAKKPVPWVRVYTLMPGVQWSHRRHLDAKVTCEECHGQVSQMDVVAEVTSVTSKVGCLNCHGARLGAKSKAACTSCHKWFEDPKVPAQSK